MLVFLFKKYCWPLIFGLFIVTRLFSLSGFGPHNDEIIYTEYAQLIHSNWRQYWNVSMGTMYSDYKDPLQYWLTSLTVSLSQDPLLGFRLLSFIFSLAAFYFFIKFTRRKTGEIGAIIGALFWIGSGFYFYFDILGLAEVYIYSIVLFLLYGIDLLLERCGKKFVGVLGISAVIIILFLAGLLFKQTMIVIVPALLLVPFLWPNKYISRYRFSVLIVLLFAVAKLLYDLIIGNAYANARNNGFGLKSNVFSFTELSRFPIETWISNTKFYFINILMSDFVLAFGLLIVLAVLIFNIANKQTVLWLKKYGFWILFWILSILPTIILLKSHNARHYSAYLFILFLIISMSFVDLLKLIKNVRYRLLLVVLTTILVLSQLSIMIVDVFRFEATTFSQIEIGDSWANPIRVNDLIVKMIDFEPGLVLSSGYWGHPGTTMDVYRELYPQLHLTLMTNSRKDVLQGLYYDLQKRGLALYIIFDRENINNMPTWMHDIMDDDFLCGKRDILNKAFRGHVLENTAIVVCYVGQAN